MKHCIAVMLCVAILICPLGALAEFARISNQEAIDRINMRASPSTDAPLIASYYNGVMIEVIERTGDWSRVTIGNAEGEMNGYILTKYIDFYEEVVPAALPVIQITSRSAELMAGPSDDWYRHCELLPGTLFAVLGEVGDWLHVIMTHDRTGFIKKEYTKPTDLASSKYGIISGCGLAVIHMPVKWPVPYYAYPVPTRVLNQMCVEGQSVVLLADLGEITQVSVANWGTAFIPTEYITSYYFSDVQMESELKAGVHEALQVGMYTFRSTEESSITITLEEKTRTYGGVGDYSFYLPEGASVQIQGDGMLTALDKTMRLHEDRYSDNGIALVDEKQLYEFMEGSGRYLSGEQIPSCPPEDIISSYLYVIRAQADELPGSYAVSDIEYDAGVADEVEWIELTPGEERKLMITQGQFLTMKNCKLGWSLGNG